MLYSSLKGKTALVVDDVALSRETVCEDLYRAGVTVYKTDKAEEAVRFVEKRGKDFFDFVLMDVVMPEMNGGEATRLIKEGKTSASEIPVIVFSAYEYDEVKNIVEGSGAEAFVQKPVNMAELAEVLLEIEQKKSASGEEITEVSGK